MLGCTLPVKVILDTEVMAYKLYGWLMALSGCIGRLTGCFTLARVLAASTRGRSHKSSFTIVCSHWHECLLHSREYSRTLAVKTTCSLACVSELAKKWTIIWNLITILLILSHVYFWWCHCIVSHVVIVHSAASTYYLLHNLLITVRIVNLRWKMSIIWPFVEQIRQRDETWWNLHDTTRDVTEPAKIRIRRMRISCAKSVGFGCGFVMQSKLPAIIATAIQVSYLKLNSYKQTSSE